MRNLSLVLASFAAVLAVGCSSPQAEPTEAAAAPAPAAPVFPACNNDSQCAQMGSCGKCESGTCVKQADCCATDADCPAGGRCRGAKCQ